MNTESEIRNGYTVSAPMKEVWSIQLQIAQHIIDVCNRHGLKIWADWGTLLGAVREHGFIPWDDDIDLMMMRDDYEKLILLADSEFKHPFFLQSFHTDKQYFHGHSQVRYNGTAAILKADILQPFHQGIFVDIFVYDNIPDQKDRKWNRSLRKAKWAQKCLLTSYYKQFCIKDPISSIKFIMARTACLLFGSGNIYRFYEKQFKKWNDRDCKCIACPTYDYRRIDKETKLKEWYKESVYLQFEDMKLPAPRNYNEVLATIYGKDYMKPCKAPSGHGETLFYTDRSYIDVLQELRQKK